VMTAVPLSRFLFCSSWHLADPPEGPVLPACAAGGRPGEAPIGSRARLRARPDLHGGTVVATWRRGHATTMRWVRATAAVRSRTGGGPLHLKNTRGKMLCSTSVREVTVWRCGTPSTSTIAMATAPFSLVSHLLPLFPPSRPRSEGSASSDLREGPTLLTPAYAQQQQTSEAPPLRLASRTTGPAQW
jgi:hypothetical protein